MPRRCKSASCWPCSTSREVEAPRPLSARRFRGRLAKRWLGGHRLVVEQPLNHVGRRQRVEEADTTAGTSHWRSPFGIVHGCATLQWRIDRKAIHCPLELRSVINVNLPGEMQPAIPGTFDRCFSFETFWEMFQKNDEKFESWASASRAADV